MRKRITLIARLTRDPTICWPMAHVSPLAQEINSACGKAVSGLLSSNSRVMTWHGCMADRITMNYVAGSLPACYHLQRLLPGPLNDARALRACQEQFCHPKQDATHWHKWLKWLKWLKTCWIARIWTKRCRVIAVDYHLTIMNLRLVTFLSELKTGTASARLESMALTRGASTLRVAAWRFMGRYAGRSRRVKDEWSISARRVALSDC